MSKARGLADLGNAYSDGALSNRNMIVNSAMQVWQRGTSSSDLGLKYLVADRFWTYAGGSGTVEQSTDVPDGFNYSLYWNRTSSGSMGTSVELTRQGYNPYGMLTYSMYVKGDFTSTALYFNFRNYSGGGADSVPIVTHSSFGNYSTWTRVVLTVDCTSVVAHSNNKMLNIEFGGFPAGGKITGVQLEVGDQSTPFEHRSYGDEIARCKRFYQKHPTNGATNVHAARYNTTISLAEAYFTTDMRAVPTIAYGAGSGTVSNTTASDKNVTWVFTGIDNNFINSWTADAEL